MSDSLSPPEAQQAEHLAEIDRIRSTYECDQAGLVSFNRAVEGEFDLLGQYAAAYVDGFQGKPKLAEDLVTGDPDNWHSLRIKPEDVITFGSRLQAYKEEQKAKRLGELGMR